MSNGDMLKTIKTLIENDEPFTAKQYQTMSLTGMVELGDAIKEMGQKITTVDTAAKTRVCPAVIEAQKDIDKLEGRSDKRDVLVGAGTILGTIAGVIFGNK